MSYHLFNCCTNMNEPDWSQFDALELGGCCEVFCTVTTESNIEGGYDRHEAQFFTVYARLKEGGCEPITDVSSFEQAEEVGEQLAIRSGLPLTIVC